MTIREKINTLANENSQPCVTISLNTHRTHPDNSQDDILLKKLLKESEDRVISEYGKRGTLKLLEKIQTVADKIDRNYNSDSLHLFLSERTHEVIRLPWPTQDNKVHISERFAVRPLIKAYNRSQEYLIMLLSQSGVSLYEAINDSILSEVNNDDFPFTENTHYETESVRLSDSKHMDNLIREFLNKVDKALVKVQGETGVTCIVVCTEDNYSRLLQVADKPDVYMGYANIDYNNTKPHQIALQSYKIVREMQKKQRIEAIGELKEAIAQGKGLSDLHEIYQAAIDGRGDLLIVHENFAQAVIMRNERTFDLASKPSQPDAIDDITSVIAWEVLSKKGRVVFAAQETLKELGEIALKTRY
ncbi:MAG: hypothetical protein JXB49_11165 [Bacteroidales bacterium]|nr:hypothetical protein [Bacteroidales bacterium]